MRLQAIEPMRAKPVDQLPKGRPGDYLYEPKWDGFRCIGLINEDRGVHLQSRRGARFNESFPEVLWALYEQLPAGTIVDGEIVRWAPDGRLDFDALQRRNTAGRRAVELARSEPCHYVVFDVLRACGRDVTGLPLTARRRILQKLFLPVPPASVLALSMQTDDPVEALAWFKSLHVAGIEGLVIKPANSRYEPSTLGWYKLKYRATTLALVGGVTGSFARPAELILGRYDDGGWLRVVGRTTRLDAAVAGQLARLLIPAGHGHPWPERLPPGWVGSQYGQREPLLYLRVEPVVVVEVAVDVATEHHRWRHAARFLRPRPDLTPADVPLNLDLDR
ncbi:ATP-dependent DNA ligase [Nonomuraea africana]|uniref:ATP-dependent DNA ligase n=1 Tax=Nonomuraea africana TaxID=46171 RepID=A0ABR9KCT1_9ACTN|nr:ATP-dependent DNA ligase [Nonomuraea africana]MBE1559822.1 ATP-dependent DNA ligase [Nonomuraea africana]